ncbi:ribosome silencing factor [candidate division WOR-1 bacterium RIFOXYA2_FULL_37_7]|uniref:Ribosomal silencing factor RsfS n=1 Tax=candidate division WOR-1 bacterium RIFOXYB2_FULL_37_13 TaxID=1802579 RepID=A0A1F4SRW2_UNCSA|nr:MAG: ribosome silencing factor [candidate division WOR-1 bacterium RIFOXYA2_FULL_37_7]OGC23057.1 MAG: ribosome silencing factor [candidate division WOR-1 bacterium RIFOXYB2_FULL_37_13]
MTKKDSTDKLLSIITKSAEDKKATDPVILDITRKGRIIDFMVIVSGESTPHLKAIAKEIEAQVKKLGIVGTIWEGTVDSGWLIFDLGSILVHIMSEKERKYYNLEELWGKEAVVYH